MIEHELVGGAVKLTTSGTNGVGAPVVGSSVVGLSLGCGEYVVYLYLQQKLDCNEYDIY